MKTRNILLVFGLLVLLSSFTTDSITSRVKRIYTSIQEKSFEALISDDAIERALNQVIRDVIDTSFSHTQKYGVVWIGNTCLRGEMLEYHLLPAFDSLRQYQEAAYASWTAYFHKEYYLKKVGLSIDIDVPMYEARELILRKARGYLATPEHVTSLYSAKKDIAIRKIKENGAEEETILALEKTRSSFEEFINSKDKKSYEFTSNHNIGFAYRRWREGGNELVKAWDSIAEDMIMELSK